MQPAIIKWAVATFLALGGIGAIVKWALSNEAAAIDRMLDKLLSDPKYRQLLILWRPDIEEALKTLDAEVDKKLDEAATQDAKKDTPQT